MTQSSTSIAPNFASLIAHAATGAPSEEDSARINFGTPRERRAFMALHTMLDVQKWIGILAEEFSGYNHGKLLKVEDFRVPAASLFWCALLLAHELGMSDADFHQCESLVTKAVNNASGHICGPVIAGSVVRFAVIVGHLATECENYARKPETMSEDALRATTRALVGETCLFANALGMTLGTFAEMYLTIE